METHVYKQVDGHEINADVFPGAGDGPRPGIVFIHGGGLIMGNREQFTDESSLVRNLFVSPSECFETAIPVHLP